MMLKGIWGVILFLMLTYAHGQYPCDERFNVDLSIFTDIEVTSTGCTYSGLENLIDADGTNFVEYTMDGSCKIKVSFKFTNDFHFLAGTSIGFYLVIEEFVSLYRTKLYRDGQEIQNVVSTTVVNIPLAITGNGETSVLISSQKDFDRIDLIIKSTDSQTVKLRNIRALVPCALLPVEYSYFDAIAANVNTIQLNWQTNWESNNEGFRILRGIDGNNFQEIGWIPSKGLDRATNDYEFIDDEVIPNVKYYYRLLQIDHDGKQELSDIVSAEILLSENAISNVYPNPVWSGSDVYIDINSQKSKTVLINIYDIQGSFIKSMRKNIEQGHSSVEIPTMNMRCGLYIAEINSIGQQSDNKVYKRIHIQ